MTIHSWFDRLIASAERKFGWLAIPNLLRWVGIFQILTFLLSRLSPGFVEALNIDTPKIVSGEVWRLIGFIALPRNDDVLWLIIGVMFLFWMNDGMEQAWGSFRVCLYAVVTALMLMATGLVLFFVPGLISAVGGLVWYEAMFLAFATLYPDMTVRLYFVIPVRMKYLGWIFGATLTFIAFSSWLVAVTVLAGILPYLLVFGPTLLGALFGGIRQRGRQSAFQSQTALPEALHRCHRCGVTDAEHPDEEFRVSTDGEEYCDTCREIRRQESSPAG